MNIQKDSPQVALLEKIKEESDRLHGVAVEVSKVIVGQEHIIEFILMAILSNGHILLEGVPGVAKTTMIKAVTQALGVTFNRIQFAPDLLPADLFGTLIFNPKTHDFETKKGPIFANLILADEINRAPAKVQSALLEAMQEQQVTLGSHSFPLDKPFLVFATQNPIEQEGTYRLPEAQVDRFMFKLDVHYPTVAQEREIVKKHRTLQTTIHQVISKQDIFNAQGIVQEIYVDEKIVEYIVNIVFATRLPDMFNIKKGSAWLQSGASPRASLALHAASRARAFLKKRHFVTPDDVKAVAQAVLGHRIALSYQAEAEGVKSRDVVDLILKSVPTP